MRPLIRTPARPSSCARSGPSPTKANRPRPSRSNASASRTTFLRSISEPTQTKAGPSPSQPSSLRAAEASAGTKASRSTPQSAISIFGRAAGIRAQRRSASQLELQITALLRRTTPRVAAVTPGISPRLATSWPCAISTNGALPASDAIAPAAPAGNRKWAKTTSGRCLRAAPIASAQSRGYFVREPPRWSIDATSTSWPISSNSPTSGTRKLPRSGSVGPGHIWVTSRMRTEGARSPEPERRSRSARDRRRRSAARRACARDGTTTRRETGPGPGGRARPWSHRAPPPRSGSRTWG